jgi:hypothetical protein
MAKVGSGGGSGGFVKNTLNCHQEVGSQYRVVVIRRNGKRYGNRTVRKVVRMESFVKKWFKLVPIIGKERLGVANWLLEVALEVALEVSIIGKERWHCFGCRSEPFWVQK